MESTKIKGINYAFNLMLLFLVFYFTLGITDSADLPMYEFAYGKQRNDFDPMFVFLNSIMKTNGFTFLEFFKFHLIVYTLTYFFFITRYTKNYFYVFLVFIVLYYVPYVNQIRYYMAFPFFLLALHYFLTTRNWFLFILFTFLALITHSAILILYLFIPMFYFLSTKNFFLVTFISAFAFLAIVLLLFQLGILQQLEHFGEYFGKGNTGSLSGGFFNSLPYFVYLSFLWFIDKKYKKNNSDYALDRNYRFLSKLSFFTIIFIPASFITQVLGHRYVFPFLIIWIIYYMYMIRNQSKQQKLFSFLLFALVHIVAGFCIYILPNIVFGESSFEYELEKSLKSIEYIDFIF
ncbi:EpsG family protein [Chryseobacterium sp. MP_3.2]|uniref:EpsG family protein n=1 Tax=Chryseobacterium sp. MP_3.2 TaxID=3071712 RepID=UPI002E10BB4F